MANSTSAADLPTEPGACYLDTMCEECHGNRYVETPMGRMECGTCGGVMIVDREEIGRYGSGIDYGAKRLMIARTQDRSKLAWWQKGHTAWSGVGETSYFPTMLVLCDGGDHARADFTHMERGEGRWTLRRAIDLHRSAVAEFIGCEPAQLDPRHTVVAGWSSP